MDFNKEFDLNQLPIEDEFDLNQPPIGAECSMLLLENSELEPFIGQCFLSEEEAFVFYREYANKRGFSIRKGRFDQKNGTIKRRDFFCHRQGRQPLKVVDPSKEQRNRTSSKCDCKAHLRISFRKSCEIFPEQWHVTEFVANHNHKLLSSSQVRFLPSNRNITEDDYERILLLKEAGLAVRQIERVMELEKNIKHGELPFFNA